jgi:hypothetical protein
MKGCEYVYCGQPVGYCREPCESVAYNGCHDNHTVFDQARRRRRRRQGCCLFGGERESVLLLRRNVFAAAAG